MKTVLVIDDDSLVRGMMAGVLRKKGFNVMEAGDGNEGLQVVLHNHVDLVVTDMLMPDKEGVETIIELRQINSEMKIIAMSGGGKKQDLTFLKLATQVGANEVLKKPFKPSALLEAINTLLGE